MNSAHILDGDDGLVGEGLQQPDLPFCKWADLGADRDDHAERNGIAEQRHREHRVMPVTRLERPADRVLLLRQHGKVVHMHRRPVQDGAASDGAANS